MGWFVLASVSRPALETTQLPIQRVPGVVSPAIKRPECEADHSPQSSFEVKNVWSYIPLPNKSLLSDA